MKRSVLGGALVGLSVLCVLLVGNATTVAAAGGQAFSIAPPLLDLKADPGQTVSTEVQFTNLSAETLVLTAQANDFGAKDENGTPNILLDNTEKSPYTLKDWLRLPGPITLKSGEVRKINFSIAVPANAEPGGHYGVIRFSGTNPETGASSGVALSASLGSLILLRVSGDVQEKASLADFYSVTKNGAKQNFFQKKPVNFVLRIRNNGNVHFAPTGTLTIKNLLGRTVATQRINGTPGNLKDPPKNVLPGSIRRFQATLDQGWMFGRYTAHLDLTYGQNSKHLISTVSFWVIPYKLVLSVLGGLLVVVLIVIAGLRRYKSRILKQHSQQKEL